MRWQNIRPAWLLSGLILFGFILGLVGDQFNVCPKSIPSICDNATYFLAQNNSIVVYLHQYYQLFTSILVTDSPLDAGFNLIAVLIFDRLTDGAFNKSRYFLIFFLTAFLGNVLTLSQGPNYASAGASGGIFGLIAAAFSFSWAKERRIEISTLAFFLLIFVGSSFLISDVNYVAHLGGAIGGFIAGPLLYRSLKSSLPDYVNADRSLKSTEIGTAVLILGLTLFSIIQFATFVG